MRPLPPSVLLLLAPLVFACRAHEPPPPRPTAGPRLVAVGDLHGDLPHALEALHLAGVVDTEGHWSGGDATLVQTGDMVDRGAQSREILALMRRLQGEAEGAGGCVEALLGNHEVMNLEGDWRYVSADDLAGYGGEAARRAAFAREGEDGAWLWARPVVLRVGSTVFVHGGVTPEAAALGVEALDARFRAALSEEGESDLVGREGPVWYRGYLLGGVTEACPDLQRALASLGATRMVVGHTTQDDGRIAVRCQGALLGIDTGISAHYGAHVAALELRGDDAWALYPAGPEDLPDPP